MTVDLTDEHQFLDKGKVVSFLMNDKCAAGTGRGMEVFADLMGVSVEEVGNRSLQVDEEPEPVSSACVVFAKSEAVGLLRSGWSTEKVLAACCSAMAHRIRSLLERNGIEPDLGITGGIAKNSGVVTRLEKELNMKFLTPKHDTRDLYSKFVFPPRLGPCGNMRHLRCRNRGKRRACPGVRNKSDPRYEYIFQNKKGS